MPPVRLNSSPLPGRHLVAPRRAVPQLPDFARRPMVLARQQGARQLSLFGPPLGGR